MFFVQGMRHSEAQEYSQLDREKSNWRPESWHRRRPSRAQIPAGPLRIGQRILLSQGHC